MNETETEPPNGIVQGVSLFTTAVAVVVPTAVALGIRWWMRLGESNVSMTEILRGAADEEEESSPEPSNNGLQLDIDDVRASPWPSELPGIEAILAYDDLKEAIVARVEDNGGLLSPEDRAPLRHALMDRCQQHVAWLLRIEKEERAIQRMAARGLISASDHATYLRFAERLDAEVIEVKEEAAWLCGDAEMARRASDEIWAIAVQIWQQRRQEKKKQDAAAASNAEPAAQANMTEAERRNRTAKEVDLANKRAEEAKSSLKGLKGGFFDKKKPSSPVVANGQTARTDAPQKEERFQATQWPSELPGAKLLKQYGMEKVRALRERPVEERDLLELAEGEAKQRLRQVLMQRCQANIPLIRAVTQEQQRMRACQARAQWGSNLGAPSQSDLQKWKFVDDSLKTEMSEVEREAEWLGDRDGTPGMGQRIWQAAFEIHQKMAAHQDERNKGLRDQHERTLRLYASGQAKPWPGDLPCEKQRDAYAKLKAEVLAKLNLDDRNRAALLHGHMAPQVVGPQVARQLRALLMARCQVSVPLIQRLQGEAKAVRVAAKRGHLEDADLAKFDTMERLLNQEIDDVKTEAEWLSDESGTRTGMADQVWPAAFQIHAKRRAEIAAMIAAKQQPAAAPVDNAVQIEELDVD